MRKLLWSLGIFVGMLWSALLFLFLFSDHLILSKEEQQKIHEGKRFWTWDSPYGPLATHYIEKGEGSKNVILLHGFRAHTYTWRYLIDPLAEAGYHVWALDFIGFGLSDKPDYIKYDMDLFVQQVHAFLDAHKMSAVDVIGSSMGGGVALSLTMNYPQQTRSLTLLSALGYPLDIPFYVSIARHIGHLWTPFLGPRMVRHCLKQIMYNHELITDEQVEAYSLPYRLSNGITSSLMTLKGFDNSYFEKMAKNYHTLTLPLFVIWGNHDTLIPISHYEKFVTDFPHAQKLLIENCGHIPQEEASAQIFESIRSFLETISS